MGQAYIDDANIIALFYNEYEPTPAGSWATALSFFNPESDRGKEKYGIFGSNPTFREWVGELQLDNLRKWEYEITNKRYAAALDITSAERRRDKSGLLERKLGTFARDSSADHWEDLLSTLINSNGLAYDGQNFFDTDHVLGDSGTIVNAATNTQIPSANVTTPTAPTPTEAANVLLEAVGHMQSFRNDRGRLVNGTARRFVVMVSTNLLFSAFRQAAAATTLTGNTDNPLRGLFADGYAFDIRLNPNVNVSGHGSMVHLFRADDPASLPFIIQQEVPVDVSLLGEGSDHYVKTDNYLLRAKTERGAGYGQFLSALRVTLS